MRLADVRDRFVTAFSFPVDRETVVGAVGDVALDAPAGEDETVREVLERADETSYGSADELYDTLVCHVGDQYIGRKYYDDRGSNAGIDSEEVSF